METRKMRRKKDEKRFMFGFEFIDETRNKKVAR